MKHRGKGAAVALRSKAPALYKMSLTGNENWFGNFLITLECLVGFFVPVVFMITFYIQSVPSAARKAAESANEGYLGYVYIYSFILYVRYVVYYLS